MNNTKIALANSYLFGELRRPVLYAKKLDVNIKTLKFNFELLGSGRTITFYVDDKFYNASTGEYKDFSVFDKLVDLKHGSTIMIRVARSVAVKDDKLYVNSYINDVYSLTDDFMKSLGRVGLKFE